MKQKIVFVVPPKVHLLDLCGPAHVFYEAVDEGANFDLLFVNLLERQNEIESSSGLWLSNLLDFSTQQLSRGDYVFIPGLDSRLLLSDDFNKQVNPFGEWLRQQYRKDVNLCSVCTGAFVLAEAGLLHGRTCTTHWKFLDRFKTRYPMTKLEGNRLFVTDGTIMTSAGVASGIDLALYLIEKTMGGAFAARVAREVVVYLRRTDTDPQLSVFLQHRNHLDNRIHQVQNYLAQHLHEKMRLEQLADLAYTSARNLTRLFKSATGITIGEYHQKLRLEKAKELLQEGHKLQAVSLACGVSISQLRQLLKHQLS